MRDADVPVLGTREWEECGHMADAIHQVSCAIVGAGQAGARAALALRKAGFEASIGLFGAEALPPYERPQLSKEFLLSNADEPAFIKAPEEWSDLGVAVCLSDAISRVEADPRRLVFASGKTVEYEQVMIATGTKPRRLAALDTADIPVHYLRTVADSLALRHNLRKDARIAIVGGGVIGLEVAAVAAQRGAAVTVIEAASSLLARALPGSVAELVEARHRAAGVSFRYGVTVSGTQEGAVCLSDGNTLAADAVVVGIGVEPEVAPVAGLGIADAQGIRVDAQGRTNLPFAFATGDVAVQYSTWHGRWMRIETWANANAQADVAARVIAGGEAGHDQAPWFWSDQFDMNLQVVGDALGDEVVMRGDLEPNRAVMVALRDGRVVGGVTLNAPREMAGLRRLVGGRPQLATEVLADPATDLRKLAAAKYKRHMEE